MLKAKGQVNKSSLRERREGNLLLCVLAPPLATQGGCLMDRIPLTEPTLPTAANSHCYPIHLQPSLWVLLLLKAISGPQEMLLKEDN